MDTQLATDRSHDLEMLREVLRKFAAMKGAPPADAIMDEVSIPIDNIVGGPEIIRRRLADTHTDLLASRLILDHAAELANSGKSCGVESSMAKLFSTEQSIQ